jgi:hypothetical protein
MLFEKSKVAEKRGKLEFFKEHSKVGFLSLFFL